MAVRPRGRRYWYPWACTLHGTRGRVGTSRGRTLAMNAHRSRKGCPDSAVDALPRERRAPGELSVRERYYNLPNAPRPGRL